MNKFEDFTKQELKRYSRHFVLPHLGIEGQKKLKKSSVLVVGAGGLGSPNLQYLAAAGVGTIGIIDFDTVDTSNLQRQVLFTEQDIGSVKATVAEAKLKKLNSAIQVIKFNEKLTSANAIETLKPFDIIVDGTDNFPTRYLINDACVLLGKPFVYGSIYRFEGQVSVFNYTDENGKKGPNYRDLFPQPPAKDAVPNCEDGGVLGSLAGIIGSMQANEVIKMLTGAGTTLSGRLFIFDSFSFESQTIKLVPGVSKYEIRELIDYEAFCNMNEESTPYEVHEITVHELHKMLEDKTDLQLIDVRTEFEHHIANIGGELMPLEEIIEYIDKIDKEKPVVMYCKVGIRSTEAILHLQSIYNFTNLINLKGGINAWATEIDNRFA